MQSILNWDRELLRLINSEWHTPFLDGLLPFLRNASFWLPLYFFLVLYGVMNYKKTGWWWVIFAACTGILTNFISSNLIKENIFRLRPCNDPELADWIRIIIGKHLPQSSSFTSSHATNHFGLAMFLYGTMRNDWGKYSWLVFVWAFSIVYAQMYVGVHYPLDILGGTIVGLLVGWFTSSQFNRQFELK
ncbi:MAG: phosphatase PAP2 family protein [Ferruginibacter sp.]